MNRTVSELLRWGKERLNKAGIEDFNISADHLLGAVLNLTRSQLILANDKHIEKKDIEKYTALIERRAQREPLQYVIGWVDFYNVSLKCDPRGLIPRPETEILVETVIEKLKSRRSPSILDIGTGSGNIAIALAMNIYDSRVTGLDISAGALELAAFNADLNKISDRLRLIEGDIADANFLHQLGRFDCIVCNPPYVSPGERHRLAPEVIQFEPAAALFTGDDSLFFFKTIVGGVSYILNPGGLLAFEVGFGQAIQIAEIMRPDFTTIEIRKDLAGIERVITGIYAGIDKE
jgi:release factor glutamine methyltransferase